MSGLARQEKNGQLSFACPLCGGFDISINAAHNLARCFACRQNFNPIELVMHRLKLGFVDSVNWLKTHLPVTPAGQNPSAPKADTAHPAAIGDILSNIMPLRPEDKSDAQCLESIVRRISRLEHHLRHLYRVLTELQSSRQP